MNTLIAPERLELTRQDKHSDLWHRLSKHFETKVQELRIKNDSDTLTDKETASVRAEINVYKRLIVLGTDFPEVKHQ